MISTNGWTDELLFKTVLNHQMKGIIFHNDMMALYEFCSLHKYSHKHKVRTKEEMGNFIKTQRYYINNYGKMPKIDGSSNTSVIPSQAYSANTKEITYDYRCKMLKESLNKWLEWEKETMELYLACCSYALTKQKKDYVLWKKLLEEASEEHDCILEEIRKLQMISYDVKAL